MINNIIKYIKYIKFKIKINKAIKEKSFFKNKEDIRTWLKINKVKANYIRKDEKYGYVVDADNVVLAGKKLKWIPIKFGKVKYQFNCSNNQLESLEFAPLETQIFHCSRNQLKSLEFVPQNIGGLFCENNLLTTLEYCPKDNLKYLDCGHNKLISLKGCPSKLLEFYCSYNQLESLEFCPEYVETFGFNNNKIMNLNYFPQNGYSVLLHNNEKLGDLQNENDFKILYQAHLESIRKIEKEKIESKIEVDIKQVKPRKYKI